MRKIISLGLVFAMCLGLAGCGDNAKYNLKDAKTCTIEGISFQYPKEWEATDIETLSVSSRKSIYLCQDNENGDGQTRLLNVAVLFYDTTKDSILEEIKNDDCYKNVEVLDNITVAGQDCYHVKYSFISNDDMTEEYIFDSPKGVVEFNADFNEKAPYSQTAESFENVSKIIPKILKTVTIEK